MRIKIKRKRAAKKPVNGEQSKPCRPTIVTVEKMFELYCLGESASAIAKKTCHSRETVNRYIQVGDLSRGIPSLKSRRERVIGAALAKADSRIIRKIVACSDKALEMFATTTERLGMRYHAAQLLDNSEHLTPDQRAYAERIAVDPDLADIQVFHRMLKDYLQLEHTFSSGAHQAPSVQVNVQQNNSTEQHTAVTSGDVQAIYQHINTLAAGSSETDVKVASIVERLSYQNEATAALQEAQNE